MLNFSTVYRPLTARPFLSGRTYREYRPDSRLSPYIACYWTSEEDMSMSGKAQDKVPVIPDTCMDIIVRVDHSGRTISGYLCGIQDRPFFTGQGSSDENVTCFAIRFHFWSAHLFINIDFKESRNKSLELDVLGKEWNRVFEQFFYIRNISGRIALVEAFLSAKLSGLELNPGLFNSVPRILAFAGREPVKEICGYSCVSQRQLERLFSQDIGLPLKRLSSIVRYQNVWRDMVVNPNFDIQDAVFRYGYSDQAHLQNEFKRFHGMTPKEARRIAYMNK